MTFNSRRIAHGVGFIGLLSLLAYIDSNLAMRCIAIGLILLIAVHIVRLYRQEGRLNVALYDEYLNQHYRWQAAMVRWRQLYYCPRDDGVFLPSDAQFVPVAQLHDYLRQTARLSAYQGSPQSLGNS